VKGRDHSEDLDVDGKITSEWILGKFDEEKCGLDASDSGQGPVAAVVNTVMNLRFP
jgi:hypothetical protein